MAEEESQEDNSPPKSFFVDMKSLEQSPGLSFRSMNALDILRESVRIIRYNAVELILTTSLLICPVSALLLSNVLVDPQLVRRMTIRLFLVARLNGLPSTPLIKHSCQRFSEMVLSAVSCFPLHMTMLLLSKTAVVYSVDCYYSKTKFDVMKLVAISTIIWRRIVSTYIWVSTVIVGCLTMFLVLLAALCNSFSILGLPSQLNLYPAVALGLVFSVIFANVIMVCNIAIVISVLEELSGTEALFQSVALIRGQTQVGLVIFLGSTIGTAFIEGLFEHRVKTLSYGDGSSRIWEGPLLVLMYSFVVLLDSMMSAVFCFSCRSNSSREMGRGTQSVLEKMVEPSLLVFKQ